MSFDNFESGYLCAYPSETVQILRDIHVTAGASLCYLPSFFRPCRCLCLSSRWAALPWTGGMISVTRWCLRAQPSGPALKSSRACASRLSWGTRRARGRVSAGGKRAWAWEAISQLLLSAWGLRVQTQQLLSAARVRAQPPDLQSGNRDLGAGESRATICLVVTVSLRVHASPARAASVSKL